MIQVLEGNAFTRAQRPHGFSLIEILFAIAMLGVGIVAILSLFTTGIASAKWSGDTTNAAMQAQSLYTRVISEQANPATTPPAQAREFIYRAAIPGNTTGDNGINGGGAPSYSWWIHADRSGTVTPARIDPNNDLFWQCRVSKCPMSKTAPLDPSKDDSTVTYPKGLYQIVIAVYRSVDPTMNWANMSSPPKQPIVFYTTFITAF